MVVSKGSQVHMHDMWQPVEVWHLGKVRGRPVVRESLLGHPP